MPYTDVAVTPSHHNHERHELTRLGCLGRPSLHPHRDQVKQHRQKEGPCHQMQAPQIPSFSHACEDHEEGRREEREGGNEQELSLGAREKQPRKAAVCPVGKAGRWGRNVTGNNRSCHMVFLHVLSSQLQFPYLTHRGRTILIRP